MNSPEDILRRLIAEEVSAPPPPSASFRAGWNRLGRAVRSDFDTGDDTSRSESAFWFLVLDNVFMAIAETAGALALIHCFTYTFTSSYLFTATMIMAAFLAVSIGLLWRWYTRSLRPFLNDLHSPAHTHFVARSAARVVRGYFRLTWLLPLLGVVGYGLWGLLSLPYPLAFAWMAIPAFLNNLHFMLRLWGSEPGRPLLTSIIASRPLATPLGIEALTRTVYSAPSTVRGPSARMLRLHIRMVVQLERRGAMELGFGGLHDLSHNVYLVMLTSASLFADIYFGTAASYQQIGLLTLAGLCATASRSMRSLHPTKILPRWLAIQSTTGCLIARVRPRPGDMPEALRRELLQWRSHVPPWSSIASNDCTLSYHPSLSGISALPEEPDGGPGPGPDAPVEYGLMKRRRVAN